jgi:hypothetical protein
LPKLLSVVFSDVFADETPNLDKSNSNLEPGKDVCEKALKLSLEFGLLGLL